MVVGERNSLGRGREASARMFNIEYFQMYSVFSKEKVSTKISPFCHRISVISKNGLHFIIRFARIFSNLPD